MPQIKKKSEEKERSTKRVSVLYISEEVIVEQNFEALLIWFYL